MASNLPSMSIRPARQLDALQRAISVFVAAALAATLVVVPLGGTSVRADETPAEKAAREIADARDRANRATDALFEAESLLDSLGVEAEQLETELAGLQTEVDDLQARVREVALNRFTGADRASSPLLNGFKSPSEQMQISALSAIISDTSDAQFDTFDSVQRDLVAKQRQLAALNQQTEDQRAAMTALRDQANAEVERLKQVEAQRLKDEAVRKALAAEQARRAQAEEAKAAAAAAKARSSQGSGAGGSTGAGSGSGRSVWGGTDWVCPTGTAAVGFGDTWHAARSGGRLHEGVDMLGARGTPLLAVVDGFAKMRNNTLGGNAIWLVGRDGNSYYYAHLDSFGALGNVSKGDVIGYLGDTGNARGTPHLHFEIHPGGGAAVNPYPTVRARC